VSCVFGNKSAGANNKRFEKRKYKTILMNIITSQDVKNFITLLQAGLKHGRRKELKNYSSATPYDSTNVIKEYYVNLEFSFIVDREIIDSFFAEDDFDLSNQVKDLLKDL